MSTSPKRGSTAVHHGDLRRTLIDATLKMISSEGTEAVSLREVAKNVGVSHNAPYRHFETREALLAAVAVRGFEELTSKLEATRLIPGGTTLVSLGQAYIDFARLNPNLFRLMFGGEIDRRRYEDILSTSRHTFDMLLGQIKKDSDPHVPDRAIGAWALVHGLAYLVVDNQLAAERWTGAVDGTLLQNIAIDFGLA